MRPIGGSTCRYTDVGTIGTTCHTCPCVMPRTPARHDTPRPHARRNRHVSYLAEYLQQQERLRDLPWREVGLLFGTSHETARQVVQGKRTPDDATLERIAANLPGVSLPKLRRCAEMDRSGPFRLPKDADMLDANEREAVLTVVRQLLLSSGKVEEPRRSWKQDSNVTRLPTPGRNGEQPVKRAARKRPTSDDVR